jgi:hypothetical protein
MKGRSVERRPRTTDAYLPVIGAKVSAPRRISRASRLLRLLRGRLYRELACPPSTLLEVRLEWSVGTVGSIGWTPSGRLAGLADGRQE